MFSDLCSVDWMSNSPGLDYLFNVGVLIKYYYPAMVLGRDPIRSQRIHRAGFSQCLMARPPSDMLVERCAAGNGICGASGDTFLSGKMNKMEILLRSGNHRFGDMGQFRLHVQVIFPKFP